MLYHKMVGKTVAHQLIWVSVTLCRELTWFVDRVEKSDGVHLLMSTGWGKNDAEVSLYCDACATGMGFWYPAGNVGFFHSLDPGTQSPSAKPAGIFYHEALAVVSALHWAAVALLLMPRTCLVIYTNNQYS